MSTQLDLDDAVAPHPLAAQQLAELRTAAERMQTWLEADCYCPCCANFKRCADDCTFASDDPEQAGRLAGAREALFGA